MNNKKLKTKKWKNTAIALTIFAITTSVSVGIAFPLANNLKNDAQIKISKNNIFKDKNNFSNFDQKITTKELPLPDGDVNPNQLVALSNHTKMPKTINGITRKFTIKTNKENGIATININFSNKHGHKETATYKISNFKTNSDIANEKIHELNINNVENKPLKKENLVVEYNVKPIENHIKHPSHNGFSFEFVRATPIDANGNTQATYQVDVNPQVVGSQPKELTFEVSGFQTQLAYAQSQIDNLIKTSISKPTKKQRVAFKVSPVVNDLNEPQANGFSFEFVRATPIDANGNTQATYQVDVNPQVVGSQPKELTFEVSGFQTEREYANKLVADLDNEDITPPTKKQEALYKHRPIASHLNPPQANGFSFEFESADPIDENGETNVRYIVEFKLKDGYVSRRRFDFKVKNFQTKKEYFDSLVQRIKKSIDSIFGGRITDPKLINSTPEQVIKNIKDVASFKRYTTRDWFDIIENPNDIKIEVIKSSKTSVLITIKIKESPDGIFKYSIFSLKEN